MRARSLSFDVDEALFILSVFYFPFLVSPSRFSRKKRQFFRHRQKKTHAGDTSPHRTRGKKAFPDKYLVYRKAENVPFSMTWSRFMAIESRARAQSTQQLRVLCLPHTARGSGLERCFIRELLDYVYAIEMRTWNVSRESERQRGVSTTVNGEAKSRQVRQPLFVVTVAWADQHSAALRTQCTETTQFTVASLAFTQPGAQIPVFTGKSCKSFIEQ